MVDDRGRSDLGLLQQSLGGRGGEQISGEALLMAFDLLYFDGHDLRQLDLSSRRHLLEGMVTDREGVIRPIGSGQLFGGPAYQRRCVF
ncbi:hypothetical protein [Rhizobium etli]|uniref:ATP-dependent DNA ligase n=1 Tax=Rhizobium etli TaxID=29449 RepID=UPI000B3356D1